MQHALEATLRKDSSSRRHAFRLAVVITLAAMTLLADGLSAVGPDQNALVEPLVESLLKKSSNAGLVVGFWADGKSSTIGFGTVSTPLGERKPDGATLFEIGSITKTFTGILLAEAVRRKEVNEDDPINRHLPRDFQLALPEAKNIRMIDLAVHRSGLPVEPLLIGLFARNPSNPYLDFDRGKLSALCSKMRLLHDPGAKYHYSNIGAGLLGHALVNVAKAESFDELVKDRIGKPLKLIDTAEAQTGAQKARLARGHTASGKPTDPWDFATLPAAGGLRSTADDMLRYAAANMGSPKTDLLTAMIDSHSERNKADAEYTIGLGWHRTKISRPVQKDGSDSGSVTTTDVICHNGGTGGYRSMLAFTPKTKIAVVVLSAIAVNDEVDTIAIKLLEKLQPR